MWFCLNRSSAPNSEVLRTWDALPGVGGGKLPREGEDAMEEEVEVAGEGGFVICVFESTVVTTEGGFLILAERLFFLL